MSSIILPFKRGAQNKSHSQMGGDDCVRKLCETMMCELTYLCCELEARLPKHLYNNYLLFSFAVGSRPNIPFIFISCLEYLLLRLSWVLPFTTPTAFLHCLSLMVQKRAVLLAVVAAVTGVVKWAGGVLPLESCHRAMHVGGIISHETIVFLRFHFRRESSSINVKHHRHQSAMPEHCVGIPIRSMLMMISKLMMQMRD